MKDRIQFAFGAEFVEVRVHARTCEIRCPRVVGAFAAGRIVDPTTAKSQLMGGLIWGVSSALHEATETDRKRARYYNTDLAEYLIPVNADIDQAEVILVPEEDHLVNDLQVFILRNDESPLLRCVHCAFLAIILGISDRTIC